jgi:hypothetical protein
MYRFNNSPWAPRPNYLRNPALHCFCSRQINVVAAAPRYKRYNWIGVRSSSAKLLCLKMYCAMSPCSVAACVTSLRQLLCLKNNCLMCPVTACALILGSDNIMCPKKAYFISPCSVFYKDGSVVALSDPVSFPPSSPLPEASVS